MSVVKVEFDPAKVKARLDGQLGKAQMELDQQVLKDSNYFIPKREGYLERSGIVASEGGYVEWNMEYAKRQYHGLPNKSLETNPNARMKWFEAAKAIWLKRWTDLVQKYMRGKA